MKTAKIFCCAVLLAASQSAAREVERLDPRPPALEGVAPAEAPAPRAALPSAGQAKPGSAANPLWAIPLRTLSATRDRPLFSPSRRPPAPVIVAAPAPPPKPMPVALKPAPPEEPPFLLLGTIVSDNQKFAFLFNTSTKLVKRLKEGEQEAGWRVIAIDFRSSVVEKDERAVTLGLPKPNDAKPAGSAGFGPRVVAPSPDNL